MSKTVTKARVRLTIDQRIAKLDAKKSKLEIKKQISELRKKLKA